MRAGTPNEGELEWANGRVSPEPTQLRVGWLLAADCWPLVAGCSTYMPLPMYDCDLIHSLGIEAPACRSWWWHDGDVGGCLCMFSRLTRLLCTGLTIRGCREPTCHA